MTIQARLETFKARSRRATPRRKLKLGSTIGDGGVEVIIHDLSATGVLLQTSARLAQFDDFEIELPEVGATNAVVVWSSGDYYGCEFATPITKAAVSAAQLRNPIQSALPLDDAPTAEALEDDDRLPFGARLRIILGTSIALWAIILWAIWRA